MTPNELVFAEAKAIISRFRTNFHSFFNDETAAASDFLGDQYESFLGKWIYKIGLHQHGQIPQVLRVEEQYASLYRIASSRIYSGHNSQTPEAAQQIVLFETTCDQLESLLNEVETIINGEGSVAGRQVPDPDVMVEKNIAGLRLENEALAKRITEQTKDLSMLELARRKTAESEKRFGSLVEKAPIPMCFYTGREMIISIANEALLDSWGRDKSVIGKPLKEALPELDGQPFLQWLDEVYTSGKQLVIHNSEARVMRGGILETVFYDLWYTPVRNEAGEVYGLLATGVNVTEKMEAIQHIESSNSRFRNMVEQATVAIALTKGVDMIFESINQPMLELIGKTAAVIGKPLSAVLPELVDQPVFTYLKSVLETGQSYQGFEVPATLVLNGVNELRYYNISYTPIAEKNGITGILHVAVDVTEQVITRRKIEDREQQLRSLVESAPFPIGVYLGREMRIQFVNRAILDAWGKGHDVVGKTYAEVLPELNNQEIYPQLDGVFTTGIAFHAKNQRVDLVVDGTLQIFYFNYSFTPLLDHEGKVYGVMNTAADVTDLIVAKQKIEKSESKFRSLIQLAPIGICIVLEGTLMVETVNDNFLEIIGKKKSQFNQSTYWEVLPEAAALYAPILQQVFETGITYKATAHRIPLVRNGVEEIVYVSFLYEPMKEGDGQVKSVMIVALDVTAEIQSRQRIEESELRWRRLTNIVPAYIFTASPEGVITFVSDKWLEFTGLTYPDAIGESYFTTIHPDDEAGNRVKWQRAMKGETIFENELRWLHHDGHYRWVVVRAEPVKNNEGQVVSWIGSGMDISELKKVQQELQESEARFRYMADVMPQIVWTSEPNGHLNYYNQSLYDYSGLTYDELKEDGWVLIVHPEDREENMLAWMEAMETGKDFIYQHRFENKNGEYRWHLSRAIPQCDSNGRIQLWIGTSTDIHAQKTFSQELEKMVKERTQELMEVNYDLERSNEELQQFAYIASHDLQEPLRKIITFANRIVTLNNDLPESILSYLDKINLSAKRMSQLINDLLDFSSTTKSNMGLKETNLNVILQDVLDDFELELQRKNAIINKADLPTIKAIPMQMTQLFHNLLSNALKFTQPGKPAEITLSVRKITGSKIKEPVSADKNMHYWEIVFQDNGIGFEQKFSEQIFAIFQRLHGKSVYEGTGIGLALCRRIADNHNGFIVAKSAENDGAAFHIFLPVA